MAREVREGVLREGRNCWRIRRAGRVAFLREGAGYYAALADALEAARHQVLLVGWDFNSRVRLRRDGRVPAAEDELAARLDAACARRRRLRIYILGWDFAVIYALEREPVPLLRYRLGSHRRVRFRLDDTHPLGGSHHMKIAVVDDALAFVGGLDVTAARWDTPAHRADDPRRSDPGFADYGPFHDLQMAVDGEAARSVGDLARWRWHHATGRRLRPPPRVADLWPSGATPAARDVPVALARTLPAFHDEPEVREVEQLYLDAIGGARRWIFIENQYLTAARVGDALAARLAEPDGPEVVAVVPEVSGGWLESSSMGLLRARLVERLRAADHHHRLRVVYPRLPDLPDTARYTIHSKVLVVDDAFARVGSANLANRSMGLDSECDLAFEADGRDDLRRAIASLRDGLLAEHLDVAPARVAELLADTGSLVRTLDALAGEGRTLRPLDTALPEWIDAALPAPTLLDPERPVDFDALVRELGPEPEERRKVGAGLRVVAVGLGVIGLVALWRFSPLAEWLRPEALKGLVTGIAAHPASAPIAVAVVALGCVILVPLTLMVVVAGAVLGWMEGIAVSLAGGLLGAAGSYGIGALLWRDAVRSLAGPRLDALSRRLGRRGVLSVAAIRLVPIAPYGIVNMVAGASHVSLRDFLVGTAIGFGPGIVFLSVAADRVGMAALDADPRGLLGAAAIALAALVGLYGVQRLARRVFGGAPDAGTDAEDEAGGA